MARMWLRCPCSSCRPSLSRTPREVPSGAASTSWTPRALPESTTCTQPPRINDARPATPPVCTTTGPATTSTFCFCPTACRTSSAVCRTAVSTWRSEEMPLDMKANERRSRSFDSGITRMPRSPTTIWSPERRSHRRRQYARPAANTTMASFRSEREAVALLRFRNHADAAQPHHDLVARAQVAQTAAVRAPCGHHHHGVHSLVLHFDPLLAIAHVGPVIGGGVELLRRAAVALHRRQLGVAGIGWGAAQAQQLVQQAEERTLVRRLHFESQIGRFTIGLADAELLHFETAVVLHDLVEDVLHDVGVDQMAFGFDHFLKWHRTSIVAAAALGAGIAGVMYWVSCGPARRAKDFSPVRQHWESDGPASAPARGVTTDQPVPSYAPFRGWQTRPPATHGWAPWATICRPSGCVRGRFGSPLLFSSTGCFECRQSLAVAQSPCLLLLELEIRGEQVRYRVFLLGHATGSVFGRVAVDVIQLVRQHTAQCAPIGAFPVLGAVAQQGGLQKGTNPLAIHVGERKNCAIADLCPTQRSHLISTHHQAAHVAVSLEMRHCHRGGGPAGAEVRQRLPVESEAHRRHDGIHLVPDGFQHGRGYCLLEIGIEGDRGHRSCGALIAYT